MGRKKKLDRGEILGMHESGMSAEEIANAIGCHMKTVTDILWMNGRTRKCLKGYFKCPIHPLEIQGIKDRIQIGQMIWIEVQDLDEELRTRKKEEKCRVAEKHPHLLLALDSRGRRRTVTYAELAVRGRTGQ